MKHLHTAALLLLLAIPSSVAAQSDMPYAGAPCTADGGVKPTAAQIATFNRFDSALRAALKQSDATALSFLVSFPLRIYTAKGSLLIPDAQSLNGHFTEVFPQSVRDRILATTNGDYICKYDEGLGYLNGVIWVSNDDYKFTVNVVNVSSSMPASNKPLLAYTCETRTHRIVIDESGDGDSMRYRSWNKPKAVTDRPDVDLNDGKKMYEGTGVCAYPIYTFKSKNVVYEIQGALGCTDGSEPKNATGHLSVTIENKQVTDVWCF